MLNENILEGEMNDDEVLFNDNIFDEEKTPFDLEDDDAVDFESFDDSTPDW